MPLPSRQRGRQSEAASDGLVLLNFSSGFNSPSAPMRRSERLFGDHKGGAQTNRFLNSSTPGKKSPAVLEARTGRKESLMRWKM